MKVLIIIFLQKLSILCHKVLGAIKYHLRLSRDVFLLIQVLLEWIVTEILPIFLSNKSFTSISLLVTSRGYPIRFSVSRTGEISNLELSFSFNHLWAFFLDMKESQNKHSHYLAEKEGEVKMSVSTTRINLKSKVAFCSGHNCTIFLLNYPHVQLLSGKKRQKKVVGRWSNEEHRIFVNCKLLKLRCRLEDIW